MKLFKRLKNAYFAMKGRVPLHKQPPFVPEWEVVDYEMSGEQGRYNPELFASETATAELMRRFNSLAMIKKSMVVEGVYTPLMWHLRFDDGLDVNAGQLCKFYKDQPANAAPMLCVQLIGMLRQERQHPS